MAGFFFRVIEDDDGCWVCRRGRADHHSREDATDHMVGLVAFHRPSEVLVHHGNGVVEVAASFM
jgi:hypothetical protein